MVAPVFGQDTTFVKSAYGGSQITVPEGFIWQIERAFINSGDSYNIQVSSKNFQSEYTGGTKIQVPYYIAEMELLDGKDGIFYLLYIRQKRK